MTARVLISDTVSDGGIAAFERAGLEVDPRFGLTPQELAEVIAGYDGLVVRSRTQVTAELLERASRLKVIGRAGVGVDNIDLDAATRRGIVVMNTPGGSSVTVAEHTFAMMLAMVRQIPAATASMKAGRWEKKRFKGRELAGKTLGVIGMGRIGSMVAQRAVAFGMRVVVRDPYATAEAVAQLGAEAVDLDALLTRSDVISLHVPLTDRTHHLLDASRLSQVKRGAFIVNCARGGVVDEAALADALISGQVSGAALDVFEQEPPAADSPLFALDNFICAPHLGASTLEAQDAVAVQLADQMAGYLRDGSVKNAVNGPSVSRELLETLGPWLELAGRVGSMAAQLAPRQPTRLDVDFSGDIIEHDLTPLTNHLLSGLLRHFTADPVNTVNAPALAKHRGLIVAQSTRADNPDYVSAIGARLTGEGESVEVVGSVFGRHDLRIIRVDDCEIDAIPSGHLLAIRNDDVPGIVGRVGMVLGEAGVNIGSIHLTRSSPRGEAFSVINIDSQLSADVLETLRAIPHVQSVTPIRL